MRHRFFESYHRSLTKAISFRLVILAVDGLIVFGLTQNVNLTVEILTVTSVLHTLLYFLHERSWNEIHWGKHPHPKNS